MVICVINEKLFQTRVIDKLYIFRPHVDVRLKAAEKCRRLFIFRKIAKLENIAVEGNDVEEQIKAMSQYYGYKSKDLRRMIEQNGSMEDLQLDIVNAKVAELLVENAKVNEK